MSRGARRSPDLGGLSPRVRAAPGAHPVESAGSNGGHNAAAKAGVCSPRGKAGNAPVVGQSVGAVEVCQGLRKCVGLNTATVEYGAPNVRRLVDRPLQKGEGWNLQVVATRARFRGASEVANASPGSAVIVVETRVDEHLGCVAVWRFRSRRGLGDCSR